MTAPPADRRAGRPARRKWALAAVSVVVMLGLLEMLVRLFWPQPYGLSWLAPDGLLLHRPGLERHYRRAEFCVPVRINADGFRDREHALAKPPGVRRILVLGDSFSEALQVPAEQAYWHLLEQRLNQGHTGRVECINTAASGYGTDDELVLLQRRGLAYQPDLVLLQLTPHNDLSDNQSGGRFTLEGARLVEHPPRLRGRGYVNFKLWLAAHSQLYQLAKVGLKELLGTRLLVRLGVAHAPRRWQSDELDAHVVKLHVVPEPADVQAAYALTERLVLEIREVLAARRIRLLVLVVPAREQVDDARWAQFAAAAGPAALARERPQERWRAWSRQQGVALVDLLPVFRARNQRNAFYFDVDGHWNARGHALAAECLCRALALEPAGG